MEMLSLGEEIYLGLVLLVVFFFVCCVVSCIEIELEQRKQKREQAERELPKDQFQFIPLGELTKEI